MKINGTLSLLGCTALVAGLLSMSAKATQFTIDPAQSQITLGGSVAGNTLKEQGPGSLSTHFTGTIQANTTGTSIQFTGGSSIAAITNGVWAPGPGGTSGTAPADYAATASSFLGSIKGALRNLLLDVTSGMLPVNGGQFDASGLIFGFPTTSTASFDYNAGFTSGGIKLSGLSTNQIVNGATLSTVNGAQTLTIQIDTTFKFTALSDNDSSVRLTGQMVAVQSGGSTTSPTISSFVINGQTGTVRTQGATDSTGVQTSSDLSTWTSQPTTKTNDNGTTVFTFTLGGGSQGYFRLKQ